MWNHGQLMRPSSISCSGKWSFIKSLKCQHFVFDQTCDVIGEAEVNGTLFSSIHLREIDNAALNSQIEPVVSEIREGEPPSNLC